MKKRYQIASLLLAACTVCSAFAACGESEEKTDSASVGTPTAYEGKGTHEATVTATSAYMVQKGKTDYKLVIPEEPTEYETEAAILINEYVEKALGVTFPIVSGVTAESGKYISVGDTSMMRQSGISVDRNEFGESGFRIVTKSDDVYISGSRSTLRRGTYYGAQEFLKHTIDWRAYAVDEVRYTESDQMPLYNFDVTEIPEFDSRRYGSYNVTSNLNYQRLLRLSVKEEEQLPLSGHSHFKILPPETYAPLHPEWYAWKPGYNYDSPKAYLSGQLCLSNEEMQEEFVKQLVQMFRDYPTTNFAHIGQQDVAGPCECDNCKAMMAEYNTTYTGMLVAFTNRIAREVTRIIQSSEPDRQLEFEMFAYQKSIAPPVNLVDGKYVPHHEEVVPDENVAVQFTPMGSVITETMSLEKNKTFYNYLEGWCAITDNISTWTYGTNFHTANINQKNWDIATADLRTYSEHGVRRVYNQSLNNVNIAQLYEIRVWVESQLMWNVSLSYQELAEEFIENYYGPAAPHVQEMFDAMTTYYEYLRTQLECTGGWNFNLDDVKYWQFPYVESIRCIMQDAFAAVETLKTSDPNAYEKYYWRVCSAYLENIYMQMEYHADKYGEEYCLETIDLYETACRRFNVVTISEGDALTTDKCIKKWRSRYA